MYLQGENWKRVRGALQKNIFPPLEADSYLPLLPPVVDQAVSQIKRHQHELDTFIPTYEKLSLPPKNPPTNLFSVSLLS